MTWLRALKETGRSGLTVERGRLDPVVAARGAAGLAIMIAFSQWLLGPAVAAGAAFGAFQAALATLQRSWRPRPELAIASGTSLGISTFLGYLTGAHHVLFLALLAVWTFLAGMCWAAGPTVGFIATTNVAMMLVTVTLPTSVAEAAAHGAMMILGGLVQAALVVLFPVRRWRAHRDALADALAAEADYARRLRHEPATPFDPQPLMQARDAAALTSRQARRRPAELHGARGLAERIRPVLAALADPAVGAPETGPQRERVQELLAAAAAILDAAADAIRHGARATLPPGAVAAFATPDIDAVLAGPARRAALRLGALLRGVAEAAGGTAGRGSAASGGARPSSGNRSLHRPSFFGLVPQALRAMRGELRGGSRILRHALRVTAAVSAGYAIGTALPLGHGYWAPVAAAMVMRPDFSQTYSRAVGRLGGTLVGVALATGIVRLTTPGTLLAGVLAVLSAGLLYLLLRTGQLAVQACVTAYIVFLLGMGGQQWTQTVPQRVLLTLLGGLLAVVAYAVYPDWETPRLRARLADWLSANGRYAAAVIDHYAAPGNGGAGGADDRSAVRAALLNARDARIAWREASARAGTEPVRHRGLPPAVVAKAVQAVRQLGQVTMLMEAHLPDRGAAPWPAAARLAAALRTATERGAKAVREGRVPHWDEVRAVLAPAANGASAEYAPPGESLSPRTDTPSDEVVCHSAALLLAALEELSRALEGGGTEADDENGAGAGGTENEDGPRGP